MKGRYSLPGAIIFFTLTILPINFFHLSRSCAQVSPPEPLQTKITSQDWQRLERLVQIAQHHSATIKAASTALGVSAFEETVSLELSQTYSSGSFIEDQEQFPEEENSLEIALTLNPLKIISAIQQRPALKAQLQEAKQQKRVEVIKAYVAYLQARQTTQITAYQMQAFTNRHPLAARLPSTAVTQTLSNPAYVSAAQEMLSANAQEQVALAELAASVGLSESETLRVLRTEW
ncbi:MAG: hypothetical protein HC851_03985 [Acaryochloris sp. RU_4_1]|nr:hypothetical protein [Acaryochloris sp. RU_4_1]NJR54469.1 hypothetical protein [Acaryochloris sp. CRU_2_0]